MKIPSVLPITAEQSRAARFQLGLTQANVIEQSELPGYKLKQFETGRFVPDIPFLEGLRDFYAGKGIDLAAAAPNPALQAEPPNTTASRSMVRPVSRMCFIVSDDLSDEVLNQALDRMDKNDERIAATLVEHVKEGLLGGYSDETVAKTQELFGAMAENYLAFRLLQGRNIVSSVRKGVSPITYADLLAKFFAASPLASATAIPDKPDDPDDGVADDEPGEIE